MGFGTASMAEASQLPSMSLPKCGEPWPGHPTRNPRTCYVIMLLHAMQCTGDARSHTQCWPKP